MGVTEEELAEVAVEEMLVEEPSAQAQAETTDEGDYPALRYFVG